MTEEELKALQTELAILKEQKEKDNTMISDLIAERDSLKTENEKLVGESAALKDDVKKLKETNYTLARHLDTSKEREKSAEQILNEMFK